MDSYQQAISVNTLYLCVAANTGDGSRLQPFIEVLGGVANIYGSIARPGNPPGNMTNAVPNGLQGIENFAIIPNYLYITQASGSITSIILSGVVATAVT